MGFARHQLADSRGGRVGCEPCEATHDLAHAQPPCDTCRRSLEPAPELLAANRPTWELWRLANNHGRSAFNGQLEATALTELARLTRATPADCLAVLELETELQNAGDLESQTDEPSPR